MALPSCPSLRPVSLLCSLADDGGRSKAVTSCPWVAACQHHIRGAQPLLSGFPPSPPLKKPQCPEEEAVQRQQSGTSAASQPQSKSELKKKKSSTRPSPAYASDFSTSVKCVEKILPGHIPFAHFLPALRFI